jgi:hypothetical protein
MESCHIVRLTHASEVVESFVCFLGFSEEKAADRPTGRDSSGEDGMRDFS